jgi:RHS repeat-associated protein
VISRHDFLPFGEEWNPQPATTLRQFTGKERDAETGLDYFGARYYRADIGRFTTVDPLGGHLEDPQSVNAYAYARNNPLKYVDPDGRQEHVAAGSPGSRENPFRTGVTVSACDAACQLESFNRFIIEHTLGLAQPVREVLSRPWAVNWVLPVVGAPPVMGVGFAGVFAYNPSTRTWCSGLGVGASAGHSVAFGPMPFGYSYSSTPWPNNADSVLSGWSVGVGGNTPIPSGIAGIGYQASFNSAGVAHGPTAGVVGVSGSVTYSWCQPVF